MPEARLDVYVLRNSRNPCEQFLANASQSAVPPPRAAEYRPD
jgi:hypothetical protein